MGIQASDPLDGGWTRGSPQKQKEPLSPCSFGVMGERAEGREVPVHASERSLNEQRLSMVLELYCRKAGGKREGRKKERGWPWPRVEGGEMERDKKG